MAETSNILDSMITYGVKRPVITKGTHPIETRRYLLGTPEIDRMAEEVGQWIDNRTPGGIVYGRPRLGKSRALKYLMNVLPTEFGVNLPQYLMKCRQYKTSSENIFFEDLLTGVGHKLASSGKAALKRERLFKYLCEKVEVSGQNRMILFIDDAQRLTEMHYGWLMDVYNELDDAGIYMTVILVGQPELLNQRSAFLLAKKTQIVGRFMVHDFKFAGITGIQDLKACLRCYDVESEYPFGSDFSFTRYFFPEGFDSGFRLEHCGEDLLDSFITLRHEAGLFKSFEIPMQYLTLTVEYVLRRFGVDGLGVAKISRTDWKEAIKKSGYINSEIYQEVALD